MSCCGGGYHNRNNGDHNGDGKIKIFPLIIMVAGILLIYFLATK
jgi:hypothetical protein